MFKNGAINIGGDDRLIPFPWVTTDQLLYLEGKKNQIGWKSEHKTEDVCNSELYRYSS